MVGSSPLDRDWTVMIRNNDEAESRGDGEEKENRRLRPRDLPRIDFVLG